MKTHTTATDMDNHQRKEDNKRTDAGRQEDPGREVLVQEAQLRCVCEWVSLVGSGR
jgi:hypothetical protein